MRNRVGTWAIALRILCAIAFLSVGFAHKAPFAEAAQAVKFAAYTLPDGTVPDICLNNDAGGSHQKKHVLDRDCEACRISASVLLPVPSAIEVATAAIAAEPVLIIRREAFYRQLFPPNAAPRAPPVFPVTA